MFIQSRSI